jgi:YD repeat-containing protein
VVSESLNDSPYRTYEYNTDDRLYRIIQHETSAPHRVQKRYTFEYDQNGRVSVLRETNLLAPFVNYQYSLHYNETNAVDTIRQFRVMNTGLVPQQTFVLEYDDKKRLTRYAWPESYWRYEYNEAGNVSKWYAKIANVHPQEVLLAEYGNYDENSNVYVNVSPARLVNLIGGGGMSPHNPGSFKFYEGNVEPVQTGIITYLYNEKDLPSEASVSVFPAGGASTTQVYKFAYECL